MAGGIFCVEGQWESDLNSRHSVLPTLELLKRISGIPFIHKDVAMRDELFYYLDRWLRGRYSSFRVCHFAMHGDVRRLCLTDSIEVDLVEMAERLEGRWAGKKIYFASCSVLRGSDASIHEFLAYTGADLACGYTKEVDWIESAAFETVLLDNLVNGQRQDSVERRLGSARWAPLAANLGFRIVYSDGRSWRPDPAARRVPGTGGC